MRTIKATNNQNGKIVKKILVNRSRSGNHASIKSKQANCRPTISPFRNSIGLRNYPQNAVTHKQNEIYSSPNEEYFDLGPKEPAKKKAAAKPNNEVVQNIFKISKQFAQKQTQPKESQEYYNMKGDQITKDNSKFSSQTSSKVKTTQSEYFITGYLSPTHNLRRLEKEKCLSKKKTMQSMKKLLKAEERIQQNRSKHKLQSQMYEQIIQNLRKGNRFIEQSVLSKDQMSYSKLKNSGTMQTEQGESSHEYSG